MVPAGRMQASDLLQDWVDDEKMLRHALAVEGVMRYFAQQEGQGAGGTAPRFRLSGMSRRALPQIGRDHATGGLR